jgi:hypothetical protein
VFRAKVEAEQRVLWDPLGRWFRRRPLPGSRSTGGRSGPDTPVQTYEIPSPDEPNLISQDATVDVGVTDSRLE